jgi:hypothetical protein
MVRVIPVEMVRPVPEWGRNRLDVVMISTWGTGGLAVAVPAGAVLARAVVIVVKRIVVAAMTALTHAAARIPRGVNPTVYGRLTLFVTPTAR